MIFIMFDMFFLIIKFSLKYASHGELWQGPHTTRAIWEASTQPKSPRNSLMDVSDHKLDEALLKLKEDKF
jgi:hypothetical protein